MAVDADSVAVVDSSAVVNASLIVELAVVHRHYLVVVVVAVLAVAAVPVVVVAASQAFVVSYVVGLSPVANNVNNYTHRYMDNFL